MYNKVKFGQMICSRRKSQKYSREKMAEICEMSERCIGNIERGKSDPKFSTVLKICDAYKINIGELSGFAKQADSRKL